MAKVSTICVNGDEPREEQARLFVRMLASSDRVVMTPHVVGLAIPIGTMMSGLEAEELELAGALRGCAQIFTDKDLAAIKVGCATCVEYPQAMVNAICFAAYMPSWMRRSRIACLASRTRTAATGASRRTR
jgi:hypothetical protein